MTLIICEENDKFFQRAFQVSDMNNLKNATVRELTLDNHWDSTSISCIIQAMSEMNYKIYTF